MFASLCGFELFARVCRRLQNRGTLNRYTEAFTYWVVMLKHNLHSLAYALGYDF